MRVVIDPSVFVSGLIGHEGGPSSLVVAAMADEEIDVVVSPALMRELEDVLARPKIATRVRSQERAEYVARIREAADLVEDPPQAPKVVRDPKDDYLVALARAERVDAIVSGDRDLREADVDVPVLTPRQLIERLGKD